MDQTTFTLSANTLHCALELSKNSWLLTKPLQQRRGGALPRDFEGGQWPRAGHYDRGRMAVDPASAQEFTHPMVS
jgi:hypothetical protein